MNAAFCEGSLTLLWWTEVATEHGTAEANVLDTNPPTIIVTRFNAGKHHPPVEQEWRKNIGGNGSPSLIWIRTNSVPVLSPYQIPMTWGELREACQLQGINLDSLLRPAVNNLATGEAVLLIGFPIPDEIAGPTLRMHWLALLLPEKPYRQTRGFQNSERAVGWRTSNMLFTMRRL